MLSTNSQHKSKSKSHEDHFIPTTTAVKKTTTSVTKDEEKLNISNTAGGNVKWESHYGTQFNSFFKKLNINLPYYPAIPLLGIFPKEIKTYPGEVTHEHL